MFVSFGRVDFSFFFFPIHFFFLAVLEFELRALCLLGRWSVFCFFETQFCYIAQAGLELMILLPWAPKCWDYRSEPLCPASKFLFESTLINFVFLGIVHNLNFQTLKKFIWLCFIFHKLLIQCITLIWHDKPIIH
jgi:hypothetical protein